MLCSRGRNSVSVNCVAFPNKEARYETYRLRNKKSVYSHDRWVEHRNTQRYLRHMSTIFTSSVTKNLSHPLIYFTGNAVFLGVYETLLSSHVLPQTLPHLDLSNAPFELVSFALSLLLVFRTDSSYERYKEALRIWSDVRNASSLLVRTTFNLLPPRSHQPLISRWTLTFALSLMLSLHHHPQEVSLRSQIHERLKPILSPQELSRLLSSDYPPQFALHVLSKAISRAGLSIEHDAPMGHALSVFNNAIGSCARIQKYPIPLAYTRHTSRFMTIFLLLFPYSMWDACHWLVVPVTTVTAFLLLGIEEIGVQIEEPFTILPLEDFWNDIRSDVERAGQDDVAASEVLEDLLGGADSVVGNGVRTDKQNRAWQ